MRAGALAACGCSIGWSERVLVRVSLASECLVA